MDKGSEFDVYHKWLGIPPRHQPPHHYRLLGVEEFESDADVIQSAAARQIAHVQTFRIGPQSELSQKLLNEIARAKVCLLNPQSKQQYDRDLRRTLAPASAHERVDVPGLIDSVRPSPLPLRQASNELPPSISEEGFERWPAHKPRRHTGWLYGRSRFAIGGAGVALLVATVIVAGSRYFNQGGPNSASKHPTTSSPEHREWLNQTYSTTIRHLQGNEWNEYDNGTDNLRLRYKETARTPQYIYLSCPERNQELRLLLQGSRFELKRNGKWGWVATGHWAAPDRKGSTSPKAGDIIYLSDLKETGFEVWKYRPWFGFDKNGKFVDSEDRLEKKIVLGGKEYPKGIFSHPKSNGISKVSYSLADLPPYRYFEATVGVCDARRYGPQTPLLFEVWGDGALLWQSQPVKQWGQPQPCSVALPKISQLELIVRCRGDASFAFAVWCDPRLTNSHNLTARNNADEQIAVADFEGSDYGSWKTTGTAFGSRPAGGTLPGQMNVDGFVGKGFVNSFNGGDDATGRLISTAFKINRKFITFLIGGGGWAGETCVDLLVDGKVVRTATGNNMKHEGSERLEPALWDVGDFSGRDATIVIVDARKGNWGHITVDQILQTDDRGSIAIAAPPVQDAEDVTRTLALPVAVPTAGNDLRSRWIITTTDRSISDIGDGKWVEKDLKTGRAVVTYKQTARTSQFIELFCPAHSSSTRLLTNTAQQLSNGKWGWVSFGYWKTPEGDAEFTRITTQPAPDVPPDDQRLRWIDDSYMNTLSRTTEGFWDMRDNNSGKVDARHAKELSRTEGYVECMNLRGRYRFRMTAKKKEQHTDGEWKWAANGHW